jgi:hypothetical protein
MLGDALGVAAQHCKAVVRAEFDRETGWWSRSFDESGKLIPLIKREPVVQK